MQNLGKTASQTLLWFQLQEPQLLGCTHATATLYYLEMSWVTHKKLPNITNFTSSVHNNFLPLYTSYETILCGHFLFSYWMILKKSIKFKDEFIVDTFVNIGVNIPCDALHAVCKHGICHVAIICHVHSHTHSEHWALAHPCREELMRPAIPPTACVYQ